jgi:hypothetical protein
VARHDRRARWVAVGLAGLLVAGDGVTTVIVILLLLKTLALGFMLGSQWQREHG